MPRNALARRGGYSSVYAPEIIERPRRRSNGKSKALAKAREATARANKRTRKLEATFGREAPVWAAGGFIAGTVTAGAIGAAIDTTWMGIDVRLVVAAACVTGALFADLKPMHTVGLASFGLGIGAPAIATTVDEALSGVFSAAA